MFRDLFLWAIRGAPAIQELSKLEKKLSVKIIDEKAITLKNASHKISLYKKLLTLLRDPYMQHRITQIQKNNKAYEVDFHYILSVYIQSPKKTISYIKKLDQLSQPVINSPFPDTFLPFTPFPGSGPYFDLFTQLYEKNITIPTSFLHQDISDLPFLQSTRAKKFHDPETLSKSDIKYLANYFQYLSENLDHFELIVACCIVSEFRAIIAVVFDNEPKQEVLIWDSNVMDQQMQKIQELIKETSSELTQETGY